MYINYCLWLCVFVARAEVLPRSFRSMTRLFIDSSEPPLLVPFSAAILGLHVCAFLSTLPQSLEEEDRITQCISQPLMYSSSINDDYNWFSLINTSKYFIVTHLLNQKMLRTFRGWMLCWFKLNKRLIKPLLVVRVGPGTNPKYGSH